jgi:hypothetical protein
MTDRNNGPIPPPRPLRNPKPYFEAGQRVICVDASPNRLASNRKLLVASRIYVIRAIDMEPGWKWPWWGVHLEGIRHLYPGEPGYPRDDSREWAFHPGRFRPVRERRQVAERKTDITIFRELAASVTAERTVAIGAAGDDRHSAPHAPEHGGPRGSTSAGRRSSLSPTCVHDVVPDAPDRCLTPTTALEIAFASRLKK